VYPGREAVDGISGDARDRSWCLWLSRASNRRAAAAVQISSNAGRDLTRAVDLATAVRPDENPCDPIPARWTKRRIVNKLLKGLVTKLPASVVPYVASRVMEHYNISFGLSGLWDERPEQLFLSGERSHVGVPCV
jgi:hypothetical protein